MEDANLTDLKDSPENSQADEASDPTARESERESISDSISSIEPPTSENAEEETDYARLAMEDLYKLKEEFAELSSLSSIAELENPLRYASLRDMGLSPEEAYLATRKRERREDNRSHLTRSVPRSATVMPGSMSECELRAAREIFSDISDAEIKNLYKRVTQ